MADKEPAKNFTNEPNYELWSQVVLPIGLVISIFLGLRSCMIAGPDRNGSIGDALKALFQTFGFGLLFAVIIWLVGVIIMFMNDRKNLLEEKERVQREDRKYDLVINCPLCNGEGVCSRCKGQGIAYAYFELGKKETCKECGGTGRSEQIVKKDIGIERRDVPCDTCSGQGYNVIDVVHYRDLCHPDLGQYVDNRIVPRRDRDERKGQMRALSQHTVVLKEDNRHFYSKTKPRF